MSTPSTYKALIRKRAGCSRSVRDYYANFDSLVTDYPYDIAIAYCFLKLEQAYNRTLYGGVRKTRKVHTDIARSILDRQHLTREGFLILYKATFDIPLSELVQKKIKYSEAIRDRIIHGKSVQDKDARQCLSGVLDFSEGLEVEVQACARFSPFGDMRGVTGRAGSLDKSTSRLVMKGLGFALK